jgi:sialate O-acetylesterase
MKKILVCLIGLVLSAYTTAVLGQVRLPKLVSDGMVLQRDTNVKIWGWDKPGEEVTIRFLGKTYTTATNSDGEWSVVLSPMKAGGPYSMEIDGSSHIVLNDIMIGDVWVCSGQSNMQLPVRRVMQKYRNLVEHTINPNIREFIVPNMYNFKGPQKDLPYGEWMKENPWSVQSWSAVSFFFANNLWKKYHVPIGLINSSVGGTPIQAWMSKQALKNFPVDVATAEDFAKPGYIDSVNNANNEMNENWYSRVWKEDKGLNSSTPWYEPTYNDAEWSKVEIPSFRGNNDLDTLHGIVWFRREFNVPKSLAGKSAKLIMGRIVNADYDYLNGIFVGSVSYQYPPRRYDVASGILKPGRNVIAVRVFGSHNPVQFITDKPYEILIGNHKISLVGEWKYKVGAVASQLTPQTFVIYEPTGCYNAMIAPLLNYTIKGAVWYQGESNCSDPANYGKMLDAMIDDWRANWGEGNFPFLIVQLPNYGPASVEPGSSGWAEVRNAQLKALALPNTGIAVTYDIGEWNDIHPLDKGDVGKRLALAAEHVAYGDEHVVYSGPIYKSMIVRGNKITLTFTNVGTGLVAKGGPLKRFEIAEGNGKYVWAKAKIIGRDKVVVWNDAITSPTSVRYAWADNPAGANLYNKEGLPASPFEAKVMH